MESCLEIIKNISLSIGGVVFIIIGGVIYFKIYFLNKKIKKINEEIENEREILDEMEIEYKTEDGTFEITLGNQDEMNILKQKKKIEKLEREKRYLYEEISIYKIFKK